MTRAARTESQPRPIPGRIGHVLRILNALVAHARHFAATAAARAELPQFATAAAVFGTYDIPVIVNRVQRGILRALALQRYLLARAARGRNLRFAWKSRTDLLPHHRPPPSASPVPRAARALERRRHAARPASDDPDAGHMPTQEELDAWVRRRPVGRTIADICTDLGVVPGFCEGKLWCDILAVLRRYGGSLNRMYHVREKRRESFERERDKRPETWGTDWRDLSKPTVRYVFGCLIGEPPPLPHGLMPAVPALAPS